MMETKDLAWDQIPLAWKDYLKLLLDYGSILFAFAPLLVLLRTSSLDGIYIFPLLFVLSLLVMRVVEKRMYEVTRRLMRGKVFSES